MPELSTFPVQYSYLSGFSSKAPIVSLGREITWIAKFLKNKASTISEYRCSSDQFCKHILLGNYELALATIDDISAKHGHSFYLIQLRLALEQKAFGLERQKEYAKSIRRQFKRGILSFVTYYTSVRVEDRTSWDGFVTMIDEKLSQSHHGDTLNVYLRYRLTNRWPNDASGVIDILKSNRITYLLICMKQSYRFCSISAIRTRAPTRSVDGYFKASLIPFQIFV